MKYVEIPIELTDDYCPAGLEFCVGSCRKYADGYHGSSFIDIPAKWRQPDGLGVRKTELSVSVYQQDKKKKRGKRRISLIFSDHGHEINLTPDQAFQLSQALMETVEKAVGDGGPWQ